MNPFRLIAPMAAIVLATSAMLSGCATTPTNANVSAAHAAYDQASADPYIASHAAADLRQAHADLDQADQSLRNDEPTPIVDHYAYLAQRRVEVAIETGRAARADQQVADSQAERDKILLAKRSREADAQRAAAQQAQANAEQARAQAQSAETSAQQQQAAATQAQQDAANSRAEAAAAQDQLADLKAKQTDRGMVLTLGDVLFDVDRSTLKPGADRTLDKVANFMNRDPSRKLIVEGYTDSTGSAEHNDELSRERAESVRRALLDHGIAENRIQARGMGQRYEVASNTTAAGRQLNRRVELVFSGENGGFGTERQ